jgi:hypothetical protein
MYVHLYQSRPDDQHVGGAAWGWENVPRYHPDSSYGATVITGTADPLFFDEEKISRREKTCIHYKKKASSSRRFLCVR